MKGQEIVNSRGVSAKTDINKGSVNIRYLQPTTADYSIISDLDIELYDTTQKHYADRLPSSWFNSFPTVKHNSRTSVYITNDKLFNNELADVYNTVFTWTDIMRDMLVGLNNNKLICDLPDFWVATELSVDILTGKGFRVVCDDDLKSKQIDEVISNSNLKREYRNILRNRNYKYGNYVGIVNEDDLTGKLTIGNIPPKNWIPLVDPKNTKKVLVNIVFNIVYSEEYSQMVAELNLYHTTEDTMVQLIFAYNGKLGELLHEDSVEGINPITVFSNSSTGDIIGQDTYRYWDASFASVLRAYETILLLDERLKELMRIYPKKAVIKDEATGRLFVGSTGMFAYDNADDMAQTGYKQPEVKMEDAIKVYNLAVARMSRDTGLAMPLFDPSLLGTNMSAKALKTAMYVTELKMRSIIRELEGELKDLIIRLCEIKGIAVDFTDFSIKFLSGFIEDEGEKSTIINSRVGGKATMTQAEAIVEYDGVDLQTAQARAREINGVEEEPKTVQLVQNEPQAQGDSTTEDINQNLDFTLDTDNTTQGNGQEPEEFFLGGGDLNV